MAMTFPQPSRRIDAHQHFWRYSPAEFEWIDDSMSVIRRDFLPGDLLPLLNDADIDQSIAVQACQTIEETEWLLDLAEENEWIAGVVGWVPLIDLRVDQTLERLVANDRLKGVRHVLQAESAEYMLRDDFNAGVGRLEKYGLAYDVLIVEHQLKAAIEFVDRHPNQRFILDHVAKPLIASGQVEPWKTQIRELGRRPQVSCKISGMVTEAAFKTWSVDHLRPYVEIVLEAFGPGRLLFGSDWPVCTVAASHAQWLSAVEHMTLDLSEDEKALIFGGNAARIYNIPSGISEGVRESHEVKQA